jgi:hypothetical protein
MLSSEKLLKNDLAGEIDSIVKSSPFMGAQKLECKPEKNNIIINSHTLIYGIEFAICAREVF